MDPVVSSSASLRLIIELAEPPLVELTERFWTHPQLRQLFPEYLFTLHTSMRTTVPLLECAAERARALAPADPVAAELAPYFEHHATEELHHDDWLLEDMARLGMDRREVLERLPPPEIAAIIGAQYYWLFHAHPVAFLGCLAVLEGSPPEAEALDAVAARTGIPREGLRTLYKHAQLDPHHRDDLDALIDRLPLTAAQSELMGLSALTVVEQLCGVTERLLTPPGDD